MRATILLGIGFLITACSGGPTSPATNNNPNTGGQVTQSANVAMRSEDDIYGYGSTSHTFAPGVVTITRGGSVTWSNNSQFAHSVTFASVSGAPANVDAISSGSATRTFSNSGTFAYSCANHTGMSGIVNVQ